jgi:hypothetical protein
MMVDTKRVMHASSFFICRDRNGRRRRSRELLRVFLYGLIPPPPIVYSCDSIYEYDPGPGQLRAVFTSTPPAGANGIVQNKRA